MPSPLTDGQALLDPPRIDALLDDIEGGDSNLLPREAWQVPLRIDFPMWNNSAPAPGFPERLVLLWNGTAIGERTWTAPVQPDELFLKVEPHWLSEGVHTLAYEVTIYNGEGATSWPLSITIDKTAPELGGDHGRLLFPVRVIHEGITARYLEEHEDQVLAEVPAYHRPVPGDLLDWYWDAEPFEFNHAGTRMLTQDDLDRPLHLVFDGVMIRARGDGPRFVHYRISDRSGNPSAQARPVTVQVDATPVPRELRWLDVEKAVGTGARIDLDPLEVGNGTVAILDSEVTIHPQERVWVQWGAPGSAGALRALLDTGGGPRLCMIPARHIAPYMGKTLPLYYEVVDAEQSWHSALREVRVAKVSGVFPTIQCWQVSGNLLRLSDVPASGARLFLQPWFMIDTGQMINITVNGVGSVGQPLQWRVLYQHRVTAMEVFNGIGASGGVVIPLAFLQQLRRNNVFRVAVHVSFDGGETWPPEPAPNFPELAPVLVD
ncbi:hypothetical protein ACIP1T_24050 [Pseudomonas japonica]|uniref:hypothetical protein n=1 Tax=Pseudomonas japonica TaxID=256466 RepID=UPI003816F983